MFQIVFLDNAVYSELPTRLTYFTSRCVLRITLILFKDFVLTLFPSLRVPRCHVGMDNVVILYHLRVNFGIRHQHLLVFHPTFRVRRLNFWKKLRLHVCNDQLPLSSHMNSVIQLVTIRVRLQTIKKLEIHKKWFKNEFRKTDVLLNFELLVPVFRYKNLYTSNPHVAEMWMIRNNIAATLYWTMC